MSPDVDPRVVRSRSAILDAAGDLISETGVSGLTIEAVADRSGCAKTTIYRHWPTKAELIMEAVEQSAFMPTVPETRDARRAVVEILCQLARRMSDPEQRCLAMSLSDAAERDPELARLHNRFGDSRRAVVAEVLRVGISAGELPAGLDVKQAIDMLVGTLLYRILMRHETVDEASISALADRVLDADTK